MDRRTFLKASLSSILAMGISSPLLPFGHSRGPDKVKEFRLFASLAKINMGRGPYFTVWTYNGQIPGPEIRVKAGEIIRVILKNYLPEGTTIHWHGLPLPNAMDGVPEVTQKPVMPGQTYIYEFKAHPAGSYIYHSHFGYQLDQGLYGPLIIEPADGQENYDREYTLMLEDWVMKDGGGVALTRRRPMGMMERMRGGRGSLRPGRIPLSEPVYDGYAINGRIYPAIEPLIVKKGERVKLRILNVSSSTIYYLNLAGHSLKITHLDGNAVLPLETDILRIGMGERYDVEFLAENPGRWILGAYDTGLGESNLKIVLEYKGINRKEPQPPIFHHGLRMANYADFQAIPGWSENLKRKERFFFQNLSGGMHSPYWTINGRVYPDTEPIEIQEGELIRFRYRNFSMMPHPMHLHGHFFKVVNPLLPRDRWIQKDTIIVDQGRQVDIQFLADNLGNWFHHCHNLYHMEAGVANVVIYKR